MFVLFYCKPAPLLFSLSFTTFAHAIIAGIGSCYNQIALHSRCTRPRLGVTTRIPARAEKALFSISTEMLRHLKSDFSLTNPLANQNPKRT